MRTEQEISEFFSKPEIKEFLKECKLRIRTESNYEVSINKYEIERGKKIEELNNQTLNFECKCGVHIIDTSFIDGSLEFSNNVVNHIQYAHFTDDEN